MKNRFALILTVMMVLALLVALNGASYVPVEREADKEESPDRSTTNGGATGTRALYDFLQESGREVMRWREPPAALLGRSADATGAASVASNERPVTFVVVGQTRTPFTNEEARDLLRWVAQGGRLVLVDREPDRRLLPMAGSWRITSQVTERPADAEIRPDDGEAMTRGRELVAPAQPTLWTRAVARVAPSRFAGSIYLWNDATSAEIAEATEDEAPLSEVAEDEAKRPPAPPEEPIEWEEYPTGEEPYESAPPVERLPETDSPPPPASLPPYGAITAQEERPPASLAPVAHLADARGALLVDYAYGQGRIILLSDPFIIANGGIARADNLILAVNTIAGASGLIAFDEYHQMRRITGNQLVAYFAGTPVLLLFGQAAMIALAILWTRGRRFARPLPGPRADRRSKLEYVASMAELQQRARAYDLAIENIYARTRRALARYGGAPYNAPRAEVAARVADRSGQNKEEIEQLMRACEDVINGEPINARQSLALITRLRELERALGIRQQRRQK